MLYLLRRTSVYGVLESINNHISSNYMYAYLGYVPPAEPDDRLLLKCLICTEAAFCFPTTRHDVCVCLHTLNNPTLSKQKEMEGSEQERDGELYWGRDKNAEGSQ